MMTATAALPTEVIRAIFLAGVEDRIYGKSFGARCSRLASWVRLWIAPSLYRNIDLWTERQAGSFLSTIEESQNASNLPYRLCTLVHYLIIKTTAFSAYDTQNTHSDTVQMEPGNFSPNGVTSDTAIKILMALSSQEEAPGWQQLTIPMVILATMRRPIPIKLPICVTLTGVDGIIWRVYDWKSLTRIRFTDYNPTFREAQWLIQLPQLTHCGFAFYHDPPLGIQIVEEITGLPRMRYVAVVVYPSSQRGPGKVDTASVRKELLKLDEPKLVVWQDTPQLIEMFEDEDVERFWERIEEIVEMQKSEKHAAVNKVQ